MIKTFILGILLGIAVAAGVLYAVPVVDQYREASIISVAPNGGNTEIFYINVPSDRVMSGGHDQAVLPPGLEWPDNDILGSVSTEIFKIRNARDSVIGVAARTSAREGDVPVLDWIVHLPARGSIYVNMNPVAGEGGYRVGEIRAGSRELAGMTGRMTERWLSDESAVPDAPAGRIELAARYIAKQEELAE